MNPEAAPDTTAGLISRCPGCATTFRVSQAQLQLREGRVRCGRCFTVFQAPDHAVATVPAATSVPLPATLDEPHSPAADSVPGEVPASEPAEPSMMTSSTSLDAAAAPEPEMHPLPEDIAEPGLRGETALPGADAMPSFLLEPGLAEPVGEGPADESASLPSRDTAQTGTALDRTEPGDCADPEQPIARVDPPDGTPEHSAESGLVEPAFGGADPSEPERIEPVIDSPGEQGQSNAVTAGSLHDAGTGDPDISRAALATERGPVDNVVVSGSTRPQTGSGLPSAWRYSQEQQRKPASRTHWAGHAGWTMLVLVLGAQLMFHFRGDLALLFPQYRGQLAALCEALECTLPLPRRSDLLSIESSELQADPAEAGTMVLAATLRNKAPFAQTPPALELTLTDAQDQAVARRVIAVGEYLPRALPGPAATQVTPEQFPAGAELSVRIRFDAAAVAAAGYRLYLFHP